MFEAIISQVKTGRVQRQLFDTMEEAEQHIKQAEDKLLNRMHNGKPKPASLRDYRMEIRFCDCPAIHKTTERVKAMTEAA